MREVTHIVIHTAAAASGGKPVDQSAATIREYHKRHNGWSDIGYHYVVRFNGAVEAGRPVEEIGSHVKGFNGKTIGICFTGHGDLARPTVEQWESGIDLVQKLREQFDVPVGCVLGHRECAGLGYDVGGKTCPGKWVDMHEFRTELLRRSALVFAPEQPEPPVEPAGTAPIRYDLTRPDPRVKLLQQFFGKCGVQVTVDAGWFGDETAGAFEEVFGVRIPGDPRP